MNELSEVELAGSELFLGIIKQFMRHFFIIFFSLVVLNATAQVSNVVPYLHEVNILHNRHEISITVTSFKDSTSIYVGDLEQYKFICNGNAVHIDRSQVFTSINDTIKLNLLVNSGFTSDSSSFFILNRGEVLKIRIMRNEKIRVPKNKQLMIYLLIDNSIVPCISRRHRMKFCYYKGVNFPEYKVLNSD